MLVLMVFASLGGFALFPTAAHAVLGGSADSVAADQARMSGTLASSSHPNYTVEQISTPAGITVREYVSPSGTVFAVSWRGPRPPDLSHLLGSYFADYQTAANQPRRMHGPLQVKTANVVVESGGHMRDLRGRAYAPSLIPPGVSADEIE